MPKLVFLLIILIAFLSCSMRNNGQYAGLYVGFTGYIDINRFNIDSIPYYFPLNAFGEDLLCDETDYLENKGYSRFLYFSNEPILMNSDFSAFRLMYLRSFYPLIVVRIVKNNSNYSLFWKEGKNILSNPLNFMCNKGKPINETEWLTFKKLIDKAGFYEMTTQIDHSGCDGSDWILEGTESGNYHIVLRWSPKDENFLQCCKYLLWITDWDF